MSSTEALCSLVLWLVCASFGLICGTIVAAACLFSMAKLHIALGVLLIAPYMRQPATRNTKKWQKIAQPMIHTLVADPAPSHSHFNNLR